MCHHHMVTGTSIPCQLCPDQMSSAVGLCLTRILLAFCFGYFAELSNSEVGLGSDQVVAVLQLPEAHVVFWVCGDEHIPATYIDFGSNLKA